MPAGLGPAGRARTGVPEFQGVELRNAGFGSTVFPPHRASTRLIGGFVAGKGPRPHGIAALGGFRLPRMSDATEELGVRWQSERCPECAFDPNGFGAELPAAVAALGRRYQGPLTRLLPGEDASLL